MRLLTRSLCGSMGPCRPVHLAGEGAGVAWKVLLHMARCVHQVWAGAHGGVLRPPPSRHA